MTWPLPREFMLRRMLAADASCDGSFVTGVTSTGIYCLPSCRARKPNPENVEFFPSPEAARATGLRACLRCRPDEYHAGIDPEERRLDAALARLDLAAVRSVAALARHLDVGTTRLGDLFRAYGHVTPAEWLARRRAAEARAALLTSDRPVARVAFDVGFESLSAFGEQFRRWNATTPLALRAWTHEPVVTLAWPAASPAAFAAREAARGRERADARLDGDALLLALRLETTGVLVALTFAPGSVRVERTPTGPLSPGDAAALHERLLHVLGLHHDPARFEARVDADPAWAPLVRGRRGLRLALTPTPFDALVLALPGVGGAPGAARLARRLGTPVGRGLFAPPSPAVLAGLDDADAARAGLTAAGADALRRAADHARRGVPDFADLARGTAPRAERALRAVPGLGAREARFVLSRGLGFADAAPPGDPLLGAALQDFLSLPARPDARRTDDLLAALAPHRALAALHLRRRHQELP